MPLELRARNITVHQTSDPEVIVAEWDYDGLVTTTGRSFQVSNIQVVASGIRCKRDGRGSGSW
jgi:hypothetical protein